MYINQDLEGRVAQKSRNIANPVSDFGRSQSVAGSHVGTGDISRVGWRFSSGFLPILLEMDLGCGKEPQTFILLKFFPFDIGVPLRDLT